MSRTPPASIAPLVQRIAAFTTRWQISGPPHLSLRPAGAPPTDLPLSEPAAETLRQLLHGSIIDSAGQTRPVYRSLVLSSFLRQSSGLYPPFTAALLGMSPSTPAGQLWQSWLLHLAGYTSPSIQLSRQALKRRQPNGTFHPMPRDTSLDAFIYDEFITLHALANLALTTLDQSLFDALHRSATYHTENTQLDNVSNQPWAMAAFAIFSETLHVAEQIEHDCQLFWTAQPGKISAITFLIYQDTFRTLQTPL